jgi:hypothetical protein
MKRSDYLASLALAVLALSACSDDRMPTAIEHRAPAITSPSFAVTGTAPTITYYVVKAGPGNQTDPHISGSRIAYTDELTATASTIRHHDLVTGADGLVPTSPDPLLPQFNDYDFLPDISGTKITFTRFGRYELGRYESAIYLYDIAAGDPAVSVAAEAGSNRVGSAISGNTVAWTDLGLTPDAAASEILLTEVGATTTTRLTDDAMADDRMALSPDGNVIVWTKCALTGTQCDIWKAVRAAGAWMTSVVTGAESEETFSDTDGQVIAYDSFRQGERDIYWQPVAGGPEQRVALPGNQRNPAVSAGVIVFESNASGNFDIWAYDTRIGVAFPLTTALADETLADVSVSSDGVVRVAYASYNGTDFDVHALSFQRSPTVVCSTASPRDQVKELLASLQGLSLTYAQRWALLTPLKAATLALFSGDKAAAIAALQNFMQLVSGPYRSALGAAAGPLLNAAQCAIDRLSVTA